MQNSAQVCPMLLATNIYLINLLYLLLHLCPTFLPSNSQGHRWFSSSPFYHHNSVKYIRLRDGDWPQALGLNGALNAPRS